MADPRSPSLIDNVSWKLFIHGQPGGGSGLKAKTLAGGVDRALSGSTLLTPRAASSPTTGTQKELDSKSTKTGPLIPEPGFKNVNFYPVDPNGGDAFRERISETLDAEFIAFNNDKAAAIKFNNENAAAIAEKTIAAKPLPKMGFIWEWNGGSTSADDSAATLILFKKMDEHKITSNDVVAIGFSGTGYSYGSATTLEMMSGLIQNVKDRGIRYIPQDKEGTVVVPVVIKTERDAALAEEKAAAERAAEEKAAELASLTPEERDARLAEEKAKADEQKARRREQLARKAKENKLKAKMEADAKAAEKAALEAKAVDPTASPTKTPEELAALEAAKNATGKPQAVAGHSLSINTHTHSVSSDLSGLLSPESAQSAQSADTVERQTAATPVPMSARDKHRPHLSRNPSNNAVPPVNAGELIGGGLNKPPVAPKTPAPGSRNSVNASPFQPVTKLPSEEDFASFRNQAAGHAFQGAGHFDTSGLAPSVSVDSLPSLTPVPLTPNTSGGVVLLSNEELKAKQMRSRQPSMDATAQTNMNDLSAQQMTPSPVPAQSPFSDRTSVTDTSNSPPSSRSPARSPEQSPESVGFTSGHDSEAEVTSPKAMERSVSVDSLNREAVAKRGKNSPPQRFLFISGDDAKDRDARAAATFTEEMRRANEAKAAAEEAAKAKKGKTEGAENDAVEHPASPSFRRSGTDDGSPIG